jgi:hypothetical protein
MSKFLTTSGAYMSIERTQAKVTVAIDHGRAHATPRKTALIDHVAHHAFRRYVGASKSRRHSTVFNVTTARWLVQGLRDDDEALVAALYDCDGGLYTTAETYLTLPSDAREDLAA